MEPRIRCYEIAVRVGFVIPDANLTACFGPVILCIIAFLFYDERIKAMSEEKDDQKDPKAKKKKEQENPLPACTSAPSAEHTRAVDDDEPCDDGRAGE
jgi:hypothetical protein